SHFYLSSHFFFSSSRRHTRSYGDWSSDMCSSDLIGILGVKTVTVADQQVLETIEVNVQENRAPGPIGCFNGAELSNFGVGAVAEIGRASCRKEWWTRGWPSH